MTTTPGGSPEIQFTLTNDGSSTVSDVGVRILFEEFPDGWESTDISNGDGEWNDSGGWSVSTLEPGQTKSGSLTMGVTENTAPGQYRFPIQAIGSEGTAVDRTTTTITVEQADTATPTVTETSTSTETPTGSPTDTETSTETATDTQTTVDREDMQVVKIRSLQRGSSTYAMVASGPITIGSETDSSAQVDGKKASGSVADFAVDTYLVPEGEEVTAIRNTGYKVIGATIDGEDIEVEDGPDVDISTFRSNSTVTIEAGDGRSGYNIDTTGNFFATDETDGSSEAVYPDEFSNGGASGSVADGGTDAYKFTGSLTSFYNYGDTTLKVFVDGKQVASVGPNEYYEPDDTS